MAGKFIGRVIRTMAKDSHNRGGKKLLLHVGTGKAGSSSIQYAMRRADRRGLLKPVCYPGLLNKVHHEAITTLYKPFDRIPRAVRSLFASDDEDYAAYVKSVREAVEQIFRRHDRLVLSAEHLYNIDEASVVSLAEHLRQQGFESVKVLMYLRDPASFFLSQAQQRVKASFRLPDPNSRITEYSSYVARWKSVFDDVEVREFSPESLAEGDVVRDFIQVMNHYFGTSITVPDKLVRRVNDSLSTEGIALVRSFREQFYANAEHQVNKPTNELIRLIQHCEGQGLSVTKPRLKPSVRDRINFLNREEVSRLREQMGQNFFPGFEPPNEVVDSVVFKNRMADIFELNSGFEERVQRLSLSVMGRLLDC